MHPSSSIAEHTAVSVSGLSRSFGKTTALDGVSFDIDEGEIFGFLGPDGAGKTTLFRILTTLLLPDAGEAFVDGLDVVGDFRELRRRLGYMPGRFSLYQDLTVEENLVFFASVFGTSVRENYDLIKDVYAQIEPFRDRKAGQLSGGMQQKLALSCALIHRPRVLFLDEPTTGVDAVSRREFWETLAGIQDRGITIVVSTPYMDEAARCDRVALFQDGTILQIDRPDRIAASYDRPLFAVTASDRHTLLSALRTLPGARSVYAFGESVHYTDVDAAATPDSIRDSLRRAGMSRVQVQSIHPGIEDVFMDLMTTRAER